MAQYLKEHLSFTQAQCQLVLEDAADGSGKKLYGMQGIFIEGDKRNANERIYPGYEIRRAVDRKSTRLNSSHIPLSRMPSSA